MRHCPGSARCTEALLVQAVLAKVKPELRDRFMPDIYVNLGCYYAMVALTATNAGDTQKPTEFSEKATKAIEQGSKSLGAIAGSGSGSELLKKQLKAELAKDEELAKLAAPYITRLRALL